MATTPSPVEPGEAIERARRHAPYLARMIDRFELLAGLLQDGLYEEALLAARAAGAGASDLGTALRRERNALALVLGIGDIAGAFPLDRVVTELSDCADRTLDRAIGHAIRRRAGDEAAVDGFIALALGKHGARELNYSSDIDPILLYDPERLARRDRDEPGEAAQRYAREIVSLLSERTPEGFAFRVDLRLRPASEVSPLAVSLPAALTHYESSALAWERAAFIRARPAAGDIRGGEEFLRAIRPFVWRSSLDFGAIIEMGRLSAKIRDSNEGPDAVGPGFDLKKGRGGIREIEFFVQIHQLIHGGREPALRVRGTREALDSLARAGRIEADDADRLGAAYDRLRVIEHRLQMVGDQQTHSIPADAEAIAGIAALDGSDDAETLLDELSDLTGDVARRYDSLLDTLSGEPDDRSGTKPLSRQVADLSFSDPADVARRVESWTGAKFRALRSEAARQAFDAIRGRLLEALADAPEPDRALARWEAVLAHLPTGINLFRLLEARPALLERLAAILSLAPTLADRLARRPELFDPLIDTGASELPGSVQEIVADLARIDVGDNYEALLDRVRQRVGEWRFVLGVQLIEGARDPREIGRALARVAEAALAVLGKAAEAEFAHKHGRFPDSEMLVLGLGRLGGGELTHLSDLDIVYLYESPDTAESDGERPLSASLYFNRLAQRFTGALSVPTSAGALYEVDTRLRPSGTQGPLAVSLDRFDRYQRDEAWTWEHMALLRARTVYGSQEARARLDAMIRDVLCTEREPAALRRDVLNMRDEMARHKPPAGSLDLKLVRGGLVDVEFVVHFLQLRDGTALDPELGQAISLLVESDALDRNFAEAHALMARTLIAARMLAPEATPPSPAARAALAKAAGVGSWGALETALGEARSTVAAAWARTFEQDLELDL
ncbi:bifunctional [glutamine synthetase] adenylyltransferase/[glutamine synthetase]-adenylyl-L-tyrosine phosphorylase [Blastomonas marina]|uniref:bifunctional [glutamine synthetase] adenylyltransferase/[glutamine synthetase]-adenylyl-L-tyrosine phosphorylase n=1 Tax=Blastomonas marina TaxID=1867408 RepID=UPI002AC89893|nr:bifunctional [glutamine synthetase] adenylyltransferase/[glutamine synthetase]-adenylyl-L-tyrosine phosphorylase [Blastomonas marina]WPZ03691.1 bifunctional [glutamine synthetase] adenylyltransferase/[glutamine synthetase]-adenylyl-L-tyrosine phosphorylase [Blastomonas marina]